MKIIPPKRASETYIQRLAGPPEAVFPLLCPVREADWIPAWDPLLVISASGVAERDCAFVTAALPANAIWYVTRHEPASWLVEMVKLTPGVTACRIGIRLRATPDGPEAEVTYCHTSLGPEGDAVVDSFTESFYDFFMQAWETRLNHYLRHGTAVQES